jgi:hypothetical protein
MLNIFLLHLLECFVEAQLHADFTLSISHPEIGMSNYTSLQGLEHFLGDRKLSMLTLSKLQVSLDAWSLQVKMLLTGGSGFQLISLPRPSKINLMNNPSYKTS